MHRALLGIILTLCLCVNLFAQTKSIAELRHDRMLALAKSYTLKGPAGEVRLNETPLFSWATPEREAVGGELYVWTVAGRPLATIGIWTYDDVKDSHELQSLSTEGLSAARNGSTVWTTRVGGLKFTKLSDSAVPDNASVRRKSQMRTILAQRFSAEVVNRQTSDVTQLRLIPQPLFRYEAATESVLDGAIYSLAMGTDPEVLVLLEARKESDGATAWYYAFAPATSLGTRGYVDGKQKWDNEDQLNNGTFALFYNK